MPKPNQKRLTRFAEVAAKTGGVFVFPSLDASLPNLDNTSAEIASFAFAKCKCNTCTAEFAHPKAKGAQPFCVLCGSGEVEMKEEVKASIAPDAELAYLSCGGCGTVNMFHESLATASPHIHCTACGCDMAAAKTSAHADFDGEEDFLVEGEGDLLPDADDLELLDLEDDIEDPVVVDAAPSAAPPSPQVDGLAPTNTSDVESPQVDGADPVNTSDIKPPTQNPGAINIVSDADEMAPEGFIDMDVTDLDETPVEAIAFFYESKKVHLAANDKIIATLTEARAGDFKDMLQTEQFRSAVAHTIETAGLKVAIANYKFKPAKVRVALAKVVQAKVAETVKTQKTAVQASADSYAEDFQQSMDLAAAGCANGFFKNRKDPLKTALVAELQGLGIKRADKVIDKVYAAYAVASSREVLEVARELAQKPVEARNGLAEAIDLTKFLPTTPVSRKTALAADDEDTGEDTDIDEDDEDDEGEDGEFATATPVKAVAQTAETASPYKSHAMRSILGAGSFFDR